MRDWSNAGVHTYKSAGRGIENQQPEKSIDLLERTPCFPNILGRRIYHTRRYRSNLQHDSAREVGRHEGIHV